MMYTDGEIGGAGRDGRGRPFALSTRGTTSIQDVAAAAVGSRRGFPLYLWKDRGCSTALVDRVRRGGL